MYTKTIDTIPQDIDKLFNEGVEAINEEALQACIQSFEAILRKRLAPKVGEQKPTLRMSKLGTPNRKLWYEFHTDLKEETSSNALKFIYGDLIELVLLFLLKQTGHTVEDEQKEVVVDGIVGHQDCKIDGVTTDIKSASSFGFKKFAKAEIFKDDPFGYIPQLSSYMDAAGSKEGAFLAVNKENGEICVLRINDIDTINVKERVKEVKEVINLPSPPIKKCYDPVPDGTSGNMTLHKNCTYCIFKDRCWADSNNGLGLRRFQYASGIKYLTEVLSTPRVPELTGNTTPSMEDDNKE